MFFGDVSAVGRLRRRSASRAARSRVQQDSDRRGSHPRLASHIDLIAASIADNGGRSCVNASGCLGSPRQHAEALAEALAAKLAQIVPRAADDERAVLAPFADPRVAERISQQIDAGLATPGARDVTAAIVTDPRLATVDGCTYLQPTIVLCDSPDHPLANREFLFPFAAVVKVTPEDMPRHACADGQDARRDGADERSRAARPAAAPRRSSIG